MEKYVLLVLLVALAARAHGKPVDADELAYDENEEEHDVGDLSGPAFVSKSARVRVPEGKRLKLACQMDGPLTNFNMLWSKPDSSGNAGILTLGTNVVTRHGEKRMRVRALPGNTGFELTIDNVEESDRGRYECKVSSVPPKSIHIDVEVGGEGEQEVLSEDVRAADQPVTDDGGGASSTSACSLSAVLFLAAVTHLVAGAGRQFQL